MTRVLVCGGREYVDYQRLWNMLDAFHRAYKIGVLIHGGARGADTLAGGWAAARKIQTSVFYANWAKWGKTAGFVRNQTMLDEGKPDVVVAFPGGTGTADMVRRATQAGVTVLEAETWL